MSFLEAQTNEHGGQVEERLLHLAGLIGAGAEATAPMQPTEEPLHHPTHLAQSAPVRPLPPAEGWLDAAPPHLLAVRVTVVGAVAGQFVGPLARPARLAADRRDAIDHLL